MENILESVAATSPSGKLSRSPSKAQPSGSFAASSKRIVQSSSRSLATSPPPGSSSRSGWTTPVQQLLEMSVTEQIARKARKSTVLDDKNALRILAIPDYDDYKIMQPYSCRSLSNKSKFVGGKDFVTRHNPQEVNEFKKQYSREVGNLNRHRSIVAPPHLHTGAQFASSNSFAFSASQALALSPSQASTYHDTGTEIWKQAFTAAKKPCWVLTDFGIATLIGPEYRITTRVSMLPALNHDNRNESSNVNSADTTLPFIPQIRSPLRPETPLSPFTEKESARIGFGVDLLDARQLAALTRTPFAMEISPPQIALGTLQRGEVYLFPVRVRNVGFKQERFRVQRVNASCAGFAATIAEASYDKESARLAPGLAAILTLTLCFPHPGKIYGRVQVATEAVGCCEVEIRGAVR